MITSARSLYTRRLVRRARRIAKIEAFFERLFPSATRPPPPPDTPARRRAGRMVDAFLLAATVAVVALIAGGHARRAAMAPPPPVSIFVSAQYWEIFGNAAGAFAAEFEEQNPGFRIAPADQERLDILFFDDGEFAALIEASALASLAPYIYAETEEDQWALPLVSFVDLFFYNIDILQRAGSDRPPRTRTEFLAAAQSVAQIAADAQEEIFPFALGLCEADLIGIRREFHPWVWALGAEIHSGFGADGALALTAQTASAVNFLAEMHREGLIAPGTFETTGQERLRQFASGRIAMMVASARDITYVRESAGAANFDVTAVPALVLGRNRLGLSGIYAGISSASAQPESAWAFLVFIAGRSHLLAAEIGAVPGSAFASLPGARIEEDPLLSKAWDIFDAAEIAEFQSGDLSEMAAIRAIRERLFQAFETE